MNIIANISLYLRSSLTDGIINTYHFLHLITSPCILSTTPAGQVVITYILPITPHQLLGTTLSSPHAHTFFNNHFLYQQLSSCQQNLDYIFFCFFERDDDNTLAVQYLLEANTCNRYGLLILVTSS